MTSDGVNSLLWNTRNQMSSMDAGSVSFQYDPCGRRSGKTIAGITTNYLYDGANVAQEISGGSPIANLLSGGLDEVFTRADSSGTANFLTDALGSTLALTDGSGSILVSYAYEPFGNTTVTPGSSTNEFQYTGRENDGTGLDFNRARYYSPAFQRFISEDPKGFYSGENLYAYALDSPTFWIDPLGKDVTIKLYPGNNPWGHIGLGVNNNNTQGFYPNYDTGASPGHVQTDSSGSVGPPEGCIIIPTSPQQDKDIQWYIDHRTKDPGLWRPGRDCANFVHDALHAGGINLDDSTFPRDLWNNMQRQIGHTSCYSVTPML